MARKPGALTEFGETCRSLRSARDMLMADQAQALGITSAFISAVETGAKAIPTEYVGKVATWLKLPASEKERLQGAADASKKSVKIQPKDGASAKMVVELAQSIERLTPRQIKQLRDIMKKGTK